MNRVSLLRGFRRSELDPNLERILRARRVVVVTGAGLSAPSGLPTYNGQGALVVPDQAPSKISDLAQRPEEVFDYYKGIAAAMGLAEPTPGHRALTICQDRLAVAEGALTIFTLNTDDLHELANANVHHVYGQLSTELCLGCGTKTPAEHKMSVCPCGGPRRPGISLAGEPYKNEAEAEFKRTMRQAEAIICVGTSGESDTVRRWVRVATDHYKAASLLLTRNPEDQFADMFETVVDGDSSEIRHYLPR